MHMCLWLGMSRNSLNIAASAGPVYTDYNSTFLQYYVSRVSKSINKHLPNKEVAQIIITCVFLLARKIIFNHFLEKIIMFSFPPKK